MPENHVRFHSANGKRLLLIVEGEADTRALLRQTLEAEYELIFAVTGAEAMVALDGHCDMLSLVLMDLNLPDMKGMEILRRIKADDRFSRIPVIVVTSDRESEAESLTLGAMDFISKPCPMPKVILARVLRTIELREDREILHSTERDPLTGLYNPDFFYRYAEQFDLHHAELAMDAIAIDVNHFHMINERYGKAYGDEVLRRIGARIRDAVQDSGGIVCRHEADTFFVYCPHRTDYPTILESAGVGLTDEGHAKTHVRLRMGVYAEVDKSIDIERRFDRARLASNTVRSNFTRGIAIYDSALHESELFEEHLLDGFHDALREKQFVVFFQPKFDIRPVEPVLCSAEALVRWNHPELGLVSPNVFIPLFERNGLIQELDNYVWRATAAQIREWKTRLGFAVPVSVNVSRVDMYDEEFVANMLRLLAEYGLTPDELLLEITESAYTEDSAQMVETVCQLREAGFKIEMDDFGAGYSSLNMISALPIDALKLDMQFVRNAFNGRKDTRMLEVVLEIADSLMVPSVAEGVETAEQMFTLKAMGCDIVQGFYFSRPVPALEFEAFLLARKAQDAPTPEKAPVRSPRSPRILHDRFTYEAMHDPLTGLYNQSAFDMLLKDADKNHIALLVAEIHGGPQAAGELCDRVIRRVAETLRKSFRSVDFICHTHDGCFVIIMTRVNSGLDGLVRSKVYNINARLLTPEAGLPPVALRVGVAFADRKAPRGTLLEDAEQALDDIRADGQRWCAIF